MGDFMEQVARDEALRCAREVARLTRLVSYLGLTNYNTDPERQIEIDARSMLARDALRRAQAAYDKAVRGLTDAQLSALSPDQVTQQGDGSKEGESS